jgi:hypothetical protein
VRDHLWPPPRMPVPPFLQSRFPRNRLLAIRTLTQGVYQIPFGRAVQYWRRRCRLRRRVCVIESTGDLNSANYRPASSWESKVRAPSPRTWVVSELWRAKCIYAPRAKLQTEQVLVLLLTITKFGPSVLRPGKLHAPFFLRRVDM